MLTKMGIKKGNKKVPAGFDVLNIPIIIIKRKTYIQYLKSTFSFELAQTIWIIITFQLATWLK